MKGYELYSFKPPNSHLRPTSWSALRSPLPSCASPQQPREVRLWWILCIHKCALHTHQDIMAGRAAHLHVCTASEQRDISLAQSRAEEYFRVAAVEETWVCELNGEAPGTSSIVNSHSSIVNSVKFPFSEFLEVPWGQLSSSLRRLTRWCTK